MATSSTSSEPIKAVRDRPNRKSICEVASVVERFLLFGEPLGGVGCAFFPSAGGVLLVGGCFGWGVAPGVVTGWGLFVLCREKPGVKVDPTKTREVRLHPAMCIAAINHPHLALLVQVSTTETIDDARGNA
jgi:hypothetical protein